MNVLGMTRAELRKTRRGMEMRRCDALWAELQRCQPYRVKRHARLTRLHARSWKRFLALGARSLVEGQRV